MGTLSQLKPSILGTQVIRAAADIFDGTTTSLFTVSGGRVNITALMMEVSDGALDGTANDVKFVANPTTGTSIDMCAVLDVVSDEEGTLYSITGTTTDPLQGTVAGGVASMSKMFTVNEGTIDLVSTGDSNNGNSALQSVELWYEPIDPGATVVTA